MEKELNKDQTMDQEEPVVEKGAESDGTVGRMTLRVPLDKGKKLDLMRFADSDKVDIPGNNMVRMRRENESHEKEKPWLMKIGSKESGTTFRGTKFKNTTKENYWMFVEAPGGVLEVYPVGDWYKFQKLQTKPEKEVLDGVESADQVEPDGKLTDSVDDGESPKLNKEDADYNDIYEDQENNE